MNKFILFLWVCVIFSGCSDRNDRSLRNRSFALCDMTQVIDVLQSIYREVQSQSTTSELDVDKFGLFVERVNSLNSIALLQDITNAVGECDEQRMRCRKEVSEILGNVLAYRFDLPNTGRTRKNFIDFYFDASNRLEGVALSDNLRKYLPKECFTIYECVDLYSRIRARENNTEKKEP